MSDLGLIKKRIYEEEKIEEILELLECENVQTEQGGSLYVASLPNGDNRRSVQIKNNESLSSSVRSRGINGDIYNIVSYILFEANSEIEMNETLPKSKQWLCEKLGYLEFIDDFYKETSGDIQEYKAPNYNKWLNSIVSKKENIITSNIPLDNSVMSKYKAIPYYEWIKEGISYNTQREFGVGLDIQSDRVIFPIHRYDGKLVGVKGRYCGSNKEIEDRYKYLYLEPCNKSIEFFNLHRAMKYIKELNEVIIVEGAKTVMKLHSWRIYNAVSIEGDSLSQAQIRLLKDLGIRIKFIFAWDKDKDAEYVKKEVDKLQGRMRYAMLDINNLLEEKDSPTDKGKKVWNQLIDENLYKIS